MMQGIALLGAYDTRLDHSETASTSSWISVDDEIRVRKSKKEKFINGKESDSELPKSPGILIASIKKICFL